jgi:hypothetical protein
VLNPPLLRPIASFLPAFFSAGAVLVSPYNRGIDHRIFIIRIGGRSLEQSPPNPALGPPAKSGVTILPRSKSFRQIAPWYARPLTVQHRFNKQTIVLRRYTDMAIAARQKVLDPFPWIVP